MLRRNRAVVSGRVEWIGKELSRTQFKNGGEKVSYGLALSIKKKAGEGYDSLFVSIIGKQAEYAKDHIKVGDFISIDAEAKVSFKVIEDNGEKEYRKRFVIEADSYSSCKGFCLNENEIHLMGYLAADPMVFKTNNKRDCIVFTVMVNRKFSSNAETFRVKYFSTEKYAETFHKGDAIKVDGCMVPSYLKNGKWVDAAEVLADSVIHPVRKDDEKQVTEPANEAQKSQTLQQGTEVTFDEPTSNFDEKILSEYGLDLEELDSMSDLFN